MCNAIRYFYARPHRGLDTYVIAMISHCGWGLAATRVPLRRCWSPPERVCARTSVCFVAQLWNRSVHRVRKVCGAERRALFLQGKRAGRLSSSEKRYPRKWQMDRADTVYLAPDRSSPRYSCNTAVLWNSNNAKWFSKHDTASQPFERPWKFSYVYGKWIVLSNFHGPREY